MKDLEKYNQKRNFKKTKEPIGKIKKSSKKLKFCIQHHLATKDHYDLRLEHNGVLLSWAVPKGPSYNTKDKRLAIHVEDHPISYRNFEGTIPQNEYGGGLVMLWDTGYYKPIVMEKNLIKFKVYGKRMKGLWTLTHFKENNWLLIKDNDYYTNFCNINIYNRSIKSNRTFLEIEKGLKLPTNQKNKNIIIINYNEITNPNKIIFENPKVSKLDIVKYYDKIANRMLPYLENRIISVIRCPDGITKHKFFQKHLENKNKYLGKVNINNKTEKESDYYYIKDSVGIISEVQMNSFEFHIWGSNAHTKNYPNILVFDLDPDEKLSLNKVREGVKNLKALLDSFHLKSYLKTSGKKGYHVVVPIQNITWKEAEKITKNIAELMASKWPDKYTTNIRKDKRKGKIFIDWLRNKKGSTSVAPYSLRLSDKPTVSMPISWEELDKIKPNEITIYKALKRLKKKDPWAHFFD